MIARRILLLMIGLALWGALMACNSGNNDRQATATTASPSTPQGDAATATSSHGAVTDTPTVTATPTPPPPPPPPPPTTTPVPSPTSVATTLITVAAADMATPTPTTTPAPAGDRSTSIIFLRDRSQSVKDICGDRFTESMKDVPDFIYHFLDGDPSLDQTDLYIGLGDFPKPTDWPTLRPLRADAPDRLTRDEWTTALAEAWDIDLVNDVGFRAAIEGALNAFSAYPAAEKHLVIFGDGILSYRGSSEWEEVMEEGVWPNPAVAATAGATATPTPAGGGRSQQWLYHQLSQAGVRLHYVLYDCLPTLPESRGKVTDTVYSDDNLERWGEVAGVEFTINASFTDNTWIKVYGRQEYRDSSSKRSKDLDDLRGRDGFEYAPPHDVFAQLLDNLLGPLLPPEAGGVAASQQGARAMLPPSFYPDPASSDLALDERRLPLPGYASSVTAHLLSLESDLVMYTDDSSEPVLNTDDELIDSFSKDLTSADAGCPPHAFRFGVEDETEDNPTRLTYPAIVWWESDTVAPGDLTITLNNVEAVAGGFLVQSRTAISGAVDFQRQIRGNGYLSNCYRAEVRAVDPTTPADRAPARIEALSWASTFTIPFDPGQMDAPTFTLNLEVLLWRNDSPVYLGGETPPPPAWTLVAAHRLDPIRFVYRPTLAGDRVFLCVEEGENVCIYTIPVDYTTADYYEPGQQPEAPGLYTLAPVAASAAKCQARTQTDPDTAHFMASGQPWYEATLRADVGQEHLLAGDNPDVSLQEPSAERPSFIFKLNRSELDDCGYEYLIIDWEDDRRDNVAPIDPIYCSFKEQRCEQGAKFTHR